MMGPWGLGVPPKDPPPMAGHQLAGQLRGVAYQEEPLIAWRAWRVVLSELQHLRLRSVSYSVAWAPGERIEAECLSGPSKSAHDTPCVVHRCGIYSLKTREGAERWATRECGGGPAVLGQVSLWGRVLRFEQGYLSQYAYPYGIALADGELADNIEKGHGRDATDVVRGLAAIYMVEVI
jgi:hypothetical protein